MTPPPILIPPSAPAGAGAHPKTPPDILSACSGSQAPKSILYSAAMDGGVAADLHTRVGLGQSAPPVRCRGDPWMRGIVVGKFLDNFQPGRRLAGGRPLLVRRYRLAAGDGTIFGRRNGVHVGYTRTALGAAAFQLSHRSALGAALGHAENWIRSPRSGVAGSDCRGTYRRLAVFAPGIQHELCVSRSSLSSLLGTCSRAPRRDFCRSSRACLLADPSFFGLDVSGDECREMK